MTESPLSLTPTDAASDAVEGGRNNKQLMLIGGIGVAAVAAIGGFLLLSGGGSSSADAPFVVPTHAAVVPAASPSASASPTGESVLPVFHGSVGDRDPFALPAAVLAAQNPAPAAATSAAPAAAAATPAATPTGLTLPGSVTVTPGSGTTVTVPAGTTTTVTVQPTFQYLQLLAAHHVDGKWLVDVRTVAGITKNVKPGTKNVAGTLFYYSGEDETTGKPTFVFQLGESMGANLTPNAKETSKNPHADKSTVVLHNGTVDGGIYAE